MRTEYPHFTIRRIRLTDIRPAWSEMLHPTHPKKSASSSPAGASWPAALRKTLRQFGSMLPLLAAVILLVGLFGAFVPPAALGRVFTGRPFLDTLMGTLVGAVTTGNAVNSYVVGRKLLADGVGVYAVAAFVFAWATVGIIQLPAEIGALGRRRRGRDRRGSGNPRQAGPPSARFQPTPKPGVGQPAPTGRPKNNLLPIRPAWVEFDRISGRQSRSVQISRPRFTMFQTKSWFCGGRQRRSRSVCQGGPTNCYCLI